MLLNILYAVSLVFVVFGIFFLCLLIFCRLILPKNDSGYFTVIAGTRDDEALLERVYAAYVQTNMFSILRKNSIVVLDFGVCDAVKKECRELLGEDTVTFCSRNDFVDIICPNA